LVQEYATDFGASAPPIGWHNPRCFFARPTPPHPIPLIMPSTMLRRFLPLSARHVGAGLVLLTAAGASYGQVAHPSPWAGWTLGAAPYTLHYSDAEQENDWEPEDQQQSYV